MMLCIDGLFIISSVPHELNEWLWLNGYLAFDKTLCIWFVILLCICDSISQWLCELFQPSIPILSVDSYLVLLNLYLRDPSLERKASFFLKVVFAVTFGIYLCNLGTFWVLTETMLKNKLSEEKRENPVGKPPPQDEHWK